MRLQAHAALMHDSVNVLVEAFSKVLRKKPDMFRAGKKSNNGQPSPVLNNGSRVDCNINKGWVTPWEHGEKISRVLRKVRPILHCAIFKLILNGEK